MDSVKHTFKLSNCPIILIWVHQRRPFKYLSIAVYDFNNECEFFFHLIFIFFFLFFSFSRSLLQKYDSELNNKALKRLKTVLCDMLSSKNIPDCA